MDNVIVKSKVKEFVDNMSVSSDFAEALNTQAVALIRKAAERAQANGRRTIMAKDL